MDKAEYLDPVCCFDASQYIGHPDSEQLAHNLIQACLVPCQNAVRDAKLSTSDRKSVV